MFQQNEVMRYLQKIKLSHIFTEANLLFLTISSQIILYLQQEFQLKNYIVVQNYIYCTKYSNIKDGMHSKTFRLRYSIKN